MQQQQERVGVVDTRQVQRIEPVSGLPRRSASSSGNGGGTDSEAADEASAGFLATTIKPSAGEASAAVDDDSDDESLDSEDVALAELEAVEAREDARNVAHLDDFHPRGMEHGAGLLRSLELKRFAGRLGTDDWVDVHARVLKLGVSFSKRIRVRFEQKRQDMDSSEVFHPEANKLRSTAQLNVELRRSIKYTGLEASVLEEMMGRDTLSRASNDEKNAAELSATFQQGFSQRSLHSGHNNKRRQGSVATHRPSRIGTGRVGTIGNGLGQLPRILPGGVVERPSKSKAEEDDESTASEDEDKLLSFEQYKEREERRAARRKKRGSGSGSGGGGRGEGGAGAKRESNCTPIEDYIKARALGFRGDRMKLRDPRPGVPVGKPRDLAVPRTADKSKLSSEKKKQLLEHLERRSKVEGDAETQRERKGREYGNDGHEIDVDDDAGTAEPGSSADDEATRQASRALKRARERAKSQMERTNDDPQLMKDMLACFEMLQMPPAQQLELLIKYSDPTSASVQQLHLAVVDWQTTAGYVRLHERVIEALRLARARRVESSTAFSDAEVGALERADCYVSMAQMFGASAESWVQAILNKLSSKCESHVLNLDAKWGDKVTFRGHSYQRARFSAHAQAQDVELFCKPLRFVGNGVLVRLNAVLQRS